MRNASLLSFDDLFAIKKAMTSADLRIANTLLLRIAQQIPGVFFYAKIALSVLDASRMCRQGIYSRYHKISSSLGVLKALQTIGVDLGVRACRAGLRCSPRRSRAGRDRTRSAALRHTR